MGGVPTIQSIRNPVAVKVIEAVAAHEGVEATSLSPLSESIDPDALNQLFHTADKEDDQTIYLQFDYRGHIVNIYPDHTITIS